MIKLRKFLSVFIIITIFMVNQVIAQDTAKSVSEPDSPLSKIILTSEEEAWLKEHPEITIAPLEDPTLSEFRLTEKEQEWIKNNPIVRVRVGSAPPLHFFEDGQYKGISIDYMDLIAERVGFQVKYVTDIPWPVALENIRDHEDIDLLLTAKIDQEREEYMAFTDIYLSMPLVIFNQTDTEYIENINDLNGKTVSVERGYIIQEKLENEFPEINLLITDTSKEAIEAVSFGIADAYIGNLSIATYIIQQNYLSNLKIAAPTPLDNHDQAMGIRNDWPELASIINKTLRRIPQKDKAAIYTKWLGSSDVEKQPLEQIPTFAKESIQQKAEDVARQIEIYLRAYPDKTLEDLQNDEAFQKIAIQPVGKTGYTVVSDFNNLVVLFHPNKDLIGTKIESLSADYPDMWDITLQAKGGYDASGKYNFPDLNNVIKDKYLYIKIIKEKTADGVGLWLAATTYLEEYDEKELLVDDDKKILFESNPLFYLIIIVLILLLLAILIKLHIIKFERNTIMVVLAIALLLIIILFIFNASNITKDLKENAINTYFNSLETTASIVDANLKREINNNLNTIQILSTRKSITNTDLIKIVELDKNFTEVFIIEPDGKVSYSSDNSHIGLSCSTKPYFLNVVKGGYLHPLYYSETMGEPSFTFSTFYNGGVLVARMNLNKFHEMISFNRNLGRSGESLFAYRNSNGDAVFFSERRFTAITESRNIILKEDINIPITQALLGNENKFSDYVDYRGVPVFAITKYIKDIDVGLVVKIDKEDVLETVSKNINNIWYSTSGIIFAIIIVMILSYFLLTKALRNEINIKTFELKKQFNKSEKQRIATLTVLSDLNAATKDLKSEIEEHERTERKLSDSEKRSSVWLSNSPICTKIVDLDFNLQYMSEQGVKQLKIDDIENFYEKPYPLHFFPDSFKLSMTSSLKEVKKNGNLIKLEGILADMKGNRLWYEHIIVPVNDDSGKLNYLMVVSMDITERKRAEDEIIKLSVAVEQSPATIVITDLGGKIIYANSKFIELTGYTIEETIGQNPRILKSGEHSKEFYKELWETITAGKEWKGQFRNLKKNGTSYWESAYISPVTDSSGKITSFIAIKEDITESKLAEAEKIQMEERLRHMEKIDAIGHLAGGIAHDFNNILTGIFGNLLMAKEKLPNDHPAFRFLEESGNALDRATSLTSQLLTFAKGGNPMRADVSIEKLVTETVNFDLSGSKVKPIFKIEKDLWTAKVDQGQIQQVFSNLTINADQAMPNGGKLYISLENSDIAKNMIPELNRGKYIKCTIRDEGTGIANKQLVQIFDPYFTTKQRGSGLGLATVYSIIKKHGCHITVKSALEKGTTFTFYLPVSDSTRVTAAKQIVNEGESVITAQNTGRILVMDDELMICELVTAILNVGGLTVETAPDGKQTIEMYKKAMKDKKPYDVLILDLTIPGGVGGKEAIRELLKINPKVKCIVSSGYANDPIMANYTEYGFKSIVSKPYSPGILLEEVCRVLKN